MSRLEPLWVAVLQTLGVFGLCAVLLQLVRRGRWVKWNHPVCATCGFNLYGLPQTSSRCPECGEELEKVRKMGVWRRRWASLVVATLLFAAGFYTVWTCIWVNRLPELNPRLPTFALLVECHFFRYAQPALWELQERAKQGQLSDRQWAAAADRAIAMGAAGWGPVPGTTDLLSRGRAAGKISDAVWSRYVKQLVRIWPTRARVLIARGKPFPVRYLATLTGSTGDTRFLLRLRPRIDVGGITVLDRTDDPIVLFITSTSNGLATFAPVIPAGTKLADGALDVTVTTVIDLLDPNNPGGAALSHERRVEHLSSFLVPAGRPTVTLLDPATLAPADVARATRLLTPLAISLAARAPKFDGFDLTHESFIPSPPIPGVDHAYRVYLREPSAGSQQLLGTLILAHSEQNWSPAPVAPAIHSDKVDVILKPAPDAAESTLSVTTILDGDLVTRDVPVRHDR